MSSKCIIYIHKYKCTNTSTQIQTQKYKYTNLNISSLSSLKWWPVGGSGLLSEAAADYILTYDDDEKDAEADRDVDDGVVDDDISSGDGDDDVANDDNEEIGRLCSGFLGLTPADRFTGSAGDDDHDDDHDDDGEDGDHHPS